MDSLSLPTQVESIDGKGLGVIATRGITQGDLILSEKALFKFHNTLTNEKEVVDRLHQMVSALDRPDQRRFFELSNNFKNKNPIFGVFQTNAIPLGSGSPHGGIFPVCSRFNSSCLPNACYSWNTKSDEERVFALRDIFEGEEVTVSYLKESISFLPRDERRAKILEEFGFLCVCQLCQEAPESCADSDKRRLELGRLERSIGDGSNIMLFPNRALGYCRQMLELLSAEGDFDMKVHGVYYDAFQICVAHSDYAHAAAFASLAVNVKRRCQGADSDGLQEMEDLVRVPETHRLAGTTKRWRSLARYRREEGTEGFNTWLWNRAS